MKILKNIILTLLFPVLMFLVMLLITANNPQCYVNGKLIFISSGLITEVAVNSCLSICVALAIWLQFKNGRFDFSGGASMVLAAIGGGVIGKEAGSPVIALVVAVAIALILNVITSLVYVFGRVPIIICTIGMTLLYESLTYILFGGNGIMGFFYESKISVFGRIPGIFIPAMIAIALFVIYTYFTTAGRRGKILANNQTAGVNIGINEKKDVIISYVFSGLILGFAAIIYVSQNDVLPQSGLSTSSILFSYIVPVFMGMFIGLASCDVIGIAMAAIGMEIMNYGLSCMNLGAGGWQQIIFGAFVLGFYTFSSQSERITVYLEKRRRQKLQQS
ncbi:hypothetical protein DWX08_10270 [Ruminococcus sp. AF18-22]|nr:hypothetical protein DWX08_10270 [Ruminococcus sp. AF18-22]